MSHYIFNIFRKKLHADILDVIFFFLICWDHLGLAIWVGVPHCVDDCTATPRCFVLGHLNLEMECCLLNINPISFLFISFQNSCELYYRKLFLNDFFF